MIEEERVGACQYAVWVLVSWLTLGKLFILPSSWPTLQRQDDNELGRKGTGLSCMLYMS